MLTKAKINEQFKGFFQEVCKAKGKRPVRQIAGFEVSGFRLHNAKGCTVPWEARYQVEGVSPPYYGDRYEVVQYLHRHQK